MTPTIRWDRPEHLPALDLTADDFEVSGDYLTEVNLFCPICPNGLGIVNHELNNPPTLRQLNHWIDEHIAEYHRFIP